MYRIKEIRITEDQLHWHLSILFSGDGVYKFSAITWKGVIAHLDQILQGEPQKYI